MRIISSTEIATSVEKIIGCAELELNQSVLERIVKARKNETSSIACEFFDEIIENARIASATGLPLCQDTGSMVFFIRMGQDVSIEGDSLNEAVSDVNILSSGSFNVPVEGGKGGVAIFFQRDGGLGGVYLETMPTNDFGKPKAEWPWIVDDINLGEMLDDVVEDTDDLIQDLEIGSSAAYLVSSLITVKVSDSILTSETTISADDLLDSGLVAFAPEVGAPITDLDLDEEKGKIYIGTAGGLYVGDISPLPAEFIKDNAAPTAVAGTTGYSIKGVVSSTLGNYLAFITKRGDDPDLLSFFKTGTTDVVTYRTLQGLPGESIQNLVWLSDSVIAIAGDRGLVAVPMSSVFPPQAVQ